MCVVHGPGLSGVASIAPPRAGTWLWHAPTGVKLSPPDPRARSFLEGYSAIVDREAGPGRHVDALAAVNAGLPMTDAAGICDELGLEHGGPVICDVGDF